MAGPKAKPTHDNSKRRAGRNLASKKYAKQRLRTEANKLRKRLAHQQKNPNDQKGTA